MPNMQFFAYTPLLGAEISTSSQIPWIWEYGEYPRNCNIACEEKKWSLKENK